jgi:agmatine/peptidylarginine deiminase
MIRGKTLASFCLFVCLVLVTDLGKGAIQDAALPKKTQPLPRYEEGRIRPCDPETVHEAPYAVLPLKILETPPAPEIFTPPEYARNSGIILRWSEWNMLIKQLIQEAVDKTNGMSVTLLVRGNIQQANATAAFYAMGIDLDQVQFAKCKTNSVWIRDYGPHFVRQDSDLAIVDSRYLVSRPLDDKVPIKIHKLWDWPLYKIPLRLSGGNLLITSRREGFLTNIIYTENPQISRDRIATMFWKYFGLEILHIFPAFPPNIDRTGHIDMWMSILNDHTVIIGKYKRTNPAYEASVITRRAVRYMQNLGFIVYRTPAWNDGPDGYQGIHYTYTNSILLNKKVLVPQYGGDYMDRDAEALAAYRRALPDHIIVGINCAKIIAYAGALHCICKNIPRISLEPK